VPPASLAWRFYGFRSMAIVSRDDSMHRRGGDACMQGNFFCFARRNQGLGKRPELSYPSAPTSPHRTGRTPFSVSGSPEITFAYLMRKDCMRDLLVACCRNPRDEFFDDTFYKRGSVFD
jgi:hypothetical protein